MLTQNASARIRRGSPTLRRTSATTLLAHTSLPVYSDVSSPVS
jgi:hypothetical protein